MPKERHDDLLRLVSFVSARGGRRSLASDERAPLSSAGFQSSEGSPQSLDAATHTGWPAGPPRELEQFHPDAAPAPAPIRQQTVFERTGNGFAGSATGQTRELGPAGRAG